MMLIRCRLSLSILFLCVFASSEDFESSDSANAKGAKNENTATVRPEDMANFKVRPQDFPLGHPGLGGGAFRTTPMGAHSKEFSDSVRIRDLDPNDACCE